MSMHENAVVLRFADRSAAYQALSDLDRLDSATVEVRGAVLIERLDGTLRVPEGPGNDVGKGAATGGLAGSLVGILGGPLGMLLGWSVGAVIGGGGDCRPAVAGAADVTLVPERVGPNETAILAEVRESDADVLNLLAMEYDAVLERCAAHSLGAELQAVEDAVYGIRRDEVQEKRDRKRARDAGKSDVRVMTLREKFAA